MIVLVATRSLKNSYAGRSNIRYHEAHRETGITEERWNTAQQSCIDKKLLRKNGSITNEGQHVCGSMRLGEAAERNRLNNIPDDQLPLHVNDEWRWSSTKELFEERLKSCQL
jgi:hypothetical protein